MDGDASALHLGLSRPSTDVGVGAVADLRRPRPRVPHDHRGSGRRNVVGGGGCRNDPSTRTLHSCRQRRHVAQRWRRRRSPRRARDPLFVHHDPQRDRDVDGAGNAGVRRRHRDVLVVESGRIRHPIGVDRAEWERVDGGALRDPRGLRHAASRSGDGDARRGSGGHELAATFGLGRDRLVRFGRRFGDVERDGADDWYLPVGLAVRDDTTGLGPIRRGRRPARVVGDGRSDWGVE